MFLSLPDGKGGDLSKLAVCYTNPDLNREVLHLFQDEPYFVELIKYSARGFTYLIEINWQPLIVSDKLTKERKLLKYLELEVLIETICPTAAPATNDKFCLIDFGNSLRFQFIKMNSAAVISIETRARERRQTFKPALLSSCRDHWILLVRRHKRKCRKEEGAADVPSSLYIKMFSSAFRAWMESSRYWSFRLSVPATVVLKLMTNLSTVTFPHKYLVVPLCVWSSSNIQHNRNYPLTRFFCDWFAREAAILLKWILLVTSRLRFSFMM